MIDMAGPDLSEFADRYYLDTASYTQSTSVEQVLDIDSLLLDPAADLLRDPVAASATPGHPGKPVRIQVVFHADPAVGTIVLSVSA